MLWSNDFAIPTAALFAFVFGIYLYLEERASWLKSFGIYVAVALIAWIALLMLATAGHPYALLRYNFMDVARDQWWYFAPRNESRRIFSVRQLTRLFSRETYFPLLVLAVISVSAIKTRRYEHVLLAWIGLVLFAGASLATVGGHLDFYFRGFYLWGSFIVVLVILRCLQLLASGLSKMGLFPLKALERILLVLSLCFLSMGALHAGKVYARGVAAAKNDANKFYVEELGGYLEAGWREYVELARRNRDQKVLEEYFGIWSSINKSFSPWPVDAVIHALGHVRNIAQSSIDQADIVITTRYDASPKWQPWNVSQNYWFYDELFAGWAPVAQSPATVVWRKIDSTRPSKKVACEISNDGKAFAVNAEPGFYRVTLTYSSSSAGRYLLMVRNNINFAWDGGRYFSLDPSATRAIFPVLVSVADGNQFDLKTISYAGAEFAIHSCAAQTIEFHDQEILHFEEG